MQNQNKNAKTVAVQCYNEDCIAGAQRHIKSRSVDLIICDPPFGIQESRFLNQYNRNSRSILPGYCEAPANYFEFTKQWISEAKRVLKDDGSMYIVSGHTNLKHILSAIEHHKLVTINHIIWKYNFGVYTSRKYVTSHYHILYIKKTAGAKSVFNQTCRFSKDDRTKNGGSLLYCDMEDVWCIKKEYQRGGIKNINKLPDELIRKMIQYSSNPGDLICDFFLGNFTTAKVAIELNRNVTGFELNSHAFNAFASSIGKPGHELLNK